MYMPPAPIHAGLLAPCGMNCLVCYQHCFHPKPCGGCRSSHSKPAHCRACRIAACAGEQGLHYCYECSQFPCALLLPMDKRYWTRYGVSLIENSRTAKEQGLQAFFQAQRARFTCPDCGGVISLHDAQCSECHRPLDEHDFV